MKPTLLFACLIVFCGCNKAKVKETPKEPPPVIIKETVPVSPPSNSILVPIDDVSGPYSHFTGMVSRKKISDTEQFVTFNTKSGTTETVRLTVGKTILYGEGDKHKYVVSNDNLQE